MSKLNRKEAIMKNCGVSIAIVSTDVETLTAALDEVFAIFGIPMKKLSENNLADIINSVNENMKNQSLPHVFGNGQIEHFRARCHSNRRIVGIETNPTQTNIKRIVQCYFIVSGEFSFTQFTNEIRGLFETIPNTQRVDMCVVVASDDNATLEILKSSREQYYHNEERDESSSEKHREEVGGSDLAADSSLESYATYYAWDIVDLN